MPSNETQDDGEAEEIRNPLKLPSPPHKGSSYPSYLSFSRLLRLNSGFKDANESTAT
jgi:hypothetical protein